MITEIIVAHGRVRADDFRDCLDALAGARPEAIRAEVSYYSDELVESGPVRDIGTERNYEEVFKL